MGYLPGVYLEPIQRKIQAQGLIAGAGAGAGSECSSRAGTMTTTTVVGEAGAGGGGDGVLKGEGPGVQGLGKVGDISAESFQKSQFYS